MNSKYLLIGAIAIGSVAVIALINSMNNQTATQKELAELRHKIEQQAKEKFDPARKAQTDFCKHYIIKISELQYFY